MDRKKILMCWLLCTPGSLSTNIVRNWLIYWEEISASTQWLLLLTEFIQTINWHSSSQRANFINVPTFSEFLILIKLCFSLPLKLPFSLNIKCIRQILQLDNIFSVYKWLFLILYSFCQITIYIDLPVKFIFPSFIYRHQLQIYEPI